MYQVATVDASGNPRVRSQIHRGFLEVPEYPAVPLLLTTTDIRTPKATQISHHSAVEVSWWIPGSSDQFRISGHARIVPANSYGLPTGAVGKDAAQCIALSALDAAGFDWEMKRRELFDNVSEHMRASWCRPTPGSALKGGYKEESNWVNTVKKPADVQTEEEEKFTQEALSNFCLMVIEPFAVDWVQMGIVPNRRTRFCRQGNHWSEQPIVP